MLVRVGIYKGTTAAGTQYYQASSNPSTAIHQASTDRHQQHSKEHNTQQPITQQHQRGTNNKTPTQGNNNNPVKGLVLLTLYHSNISV